MNEEHLRDILDRHEKRINSHADKIDKLENKQAETNIKLDNLCNTINKLASNLNKLTYAILTALVSFFFYAIQNNLF